MVRYLEDFSQFSSFPKNNFKLKKELKPTQDLDIA